MVIVILNLLEKIKIIILNMKENLKKKKRVVFISLKINGELRGCIGTIKRLTESIGEEIIRNLISAA